MASLLVCGVIGWGDTPHVGTIAKSGIVGGWAGREYALIARDRLPERMQLGNLLVNRAQPLLNQREQLSLYVAASCVGRADEQGVSPTKEANRAGECAGAAAGD